MPKTPSDRLTLTVINALSGSRGSHPDVDVSRDVANALAAPQSDSVREALEWAGAALKSKDGAEVDRAYQALHQAYSRK